jgi:alcohol dehydrogenase class IV
MSESEAADSLLKSIATLTAAMFVPTPKGFGIDPDEWTAAIPTMAQQALASGSPANNPGNPTNEDICGLYAEIWN